MNRQPSKSPSDLARIIALIIQGKIVCDLGCGGGEVMEAFLQNGADKVFGVEWNKDLYEIAKSKGLDVINGDISNMEVPEADVYYDWTPIPAILDGLEKIKKGIVIVGHAPHLNETLEQYSGIRINIPDGESNFEITIIKK